MLVNDSVVFVTPVKLAWSIEALYILFVSPAFCSALKQAPNPQKPEERTHGAQTETVYGPVPPVMFKSIVSQGKVAGSTAKLMLTVEFTRVHVVFSEPATIESANRRRPNQQQAPFPT